MATRAQVPRADGESSIGVPTKKWGNIYAYKIDEATSLGNNASLGYRQPSTAQSVGDIRYHATLPAGWYLECTTAGTTGSGALTITSPTVGGTVSDGTVTWTVRKNASTQDLTRYLPLSGGAMTGEAIGRNINNRLLILQGATSWEHGGFVELYGEDFASNPSLAGKFSLGAQAHNEGSRLFGSPAGVLTWNGNSLDKSAVVAESLGTNGYRKYASGKIEQWGIEVVPANTVKTVTLPVSVTKVLSGVATVVHNAVPTSACIAIVDMAYEIHSTTIRLAHSYTSEIGVAYRVVCI